MIGSSRFPHREEKIMARKRSMGKEILTQCCSCQKIRNSAGEWQELKKMGPDLKKTLFSHSICPDCLLKLYPEFVSAVELNL
jgi:hypothetical protein